MESREIKLAETDYTRGFTDGYTGSEKKDGQPDRYYKGYASGAKERNKNIKRATQKLNK